MATPVFPIERLIPQRPPFVMIDRIVSSNETTTVTSFLLTNENIFCEKGEFREPGMIENIAQTVAAGRGYEGALTDKAPQIGYIGSVKSFRTYFFPKVNSTLTTTVEISSQVLNFTAVKGKIFSGEQLVAECELVIAVNP